MKAKEISYDRTFNLGNYRSEKIGIIYELESTDTPESAIDAARELVLAYSTQGKERGLKPPEKPTGTPKTITGEERSPNVPGPGYTTYLKWLTYEGESQSHLGIVEVYDRATDRIVLEESYPNKSQARDRVFELTMEDIEG